MKDILDGDYINNIEGPLFVFSGNEKYLLHEVCIETGIAIVDVFGKLEPMRIVETGGIIDGAGFKHEKEQFFVSSQFAGEGEE